MKTGDEEEGKEGRGLRVTLYADAWLLFGEPIDRVYTLLQLSKGEAHPRLIQSKSRGRGTKTPPSQNLLLGEHHERRRRELERFRERGRGEGSCGPAQAAARGGRTAQRVRSAEKVVVFGRSSVFFCLFFFCDLDCGNCVDLPDLPSYPQNLQGTLRPPR